MSEAPKIYCPKEKKKVPVWHCLGSFMQQKPVCPHLDIATVDISKDKAVVKCLYPEVKK